MAMKKRNNKDYHAEKKLAMIRFTAREFLCHFLILLYNKITMYLLKQFQIKMDFIRH